MELDQSYIQNENLFSNPIIEQNVKANTPLLNKNNTSKFDYKTISVCNMKLFSKEA